jgi:hypothetical protein
VGLWIRVEMSEKELLEKKESHETRRWRGWVRMKERDARGVRNKIQGSKQTAERQG